MNTVLIYIRNMAPYMAYAVPVIWIVRLIAVRRLRKSHRSTTVCHEAGLWCFLLFMAGLASITVIPRSADGGFTGFVGMKGFSRINLIPFRIIVDSWKALSDGNWIYPMINIAGNIVMFMPAGFFTALLWKGESLKKAALAGFFFRLRWRSVSCPRRGGRISMICGSTRWALFWAMVYFG